MTDMGMYGKADKYDFDNPNKWVTVPDVPLLDEHEMTNDEGKPVAYVGKDVLEEIAHNNNRKVLDTGDPATLILGHTSDDPRAKEKPAQGFVVNYKVKPFKRNPDGQVIYAIHGDYKLRPNKAHLIEEYPRRSVELWWHKKDIDPIAMLGGSSPERDLGVVLRHARMNHVSMDVTPMSRSAVGVDSRGTYSSEFDNSREGVIKFSTHGNYSIETYVINDPNTIVKYARRRTTMNNRPKRNSKNNGYIPKERIPHKYAEIEDSDGQEDMHPIKLGADDADWGRVGDHTSEQEHDPIFDYNFEQSPFEDQSNQESEEPEEPEEPSKGKWNHPTGQFGKPPNLRYKDSNMNTEDFDGGDESIPSEEDEDEDESDPVLAKVFQSKQWHEMSSGIDQIKEMLQGMMGQQQGGMDSGMGGGDMEDEQGQEEMPAPNTGMQQQGMDQEQGMGPGEESEEEPDEDERAMHGQKPVKMMEGTSHSTGMPGPSSGYIPSFGKNHKHKNKSHHSKMSRSSSMPKTNNYSVLQQQLARTNEQNRRLRIQLSRAKAKEDIQQLESEGIVFGQTPEIADKIKYQRIEELTLAYLHDEDSTDEGEPDTYVKDKIDEMRMCYARRRPDPSKRNNMQNSGSVARYSRSEVDVAGIHHNQLSNNDDEDFEDKLGAAGSFEGISEFAELQAGPRKMSRQDAIKYCRKKYGIR
ncbi:unnamed protein product [Sphagnum balticum]